MTTPDSIDDGIDVSDMAGPLPEDDSGCGCGGDVECSCREVDRACCCDEGDMEDLPIVNPGRPEPVPTPMPEGGRGGEADPPPEAGSGQRTTLDVPEFPRPPGAAPPTAKERDLTVPDTVARSSRVEMSSTAGLRRAKATDDSGGGSARDCSCPDGQKLRCCCCCSPEEGPDRTVLHDTPASAPAGSGPAGEIPEYSRRPWGAEGASPLTQWSSEGAHGVAVTPTCPHGGMYGLYPNPFKGGYYWGCPYDAQNVVGNVDYFEAAHPGSQQFPCAFGTPNWYRDPFDGHEYYGCPVDSKQVPIIPMGYQVGGGPGFKSPYPEVMTPPGESLYECRNRRGHWEKLPLSAPPDSTWPGAPRYVYILTEHRYTDWYLPKTPPAPPAPCGGYRFTGRVHVKVISSSEHSAGYIVRYWYQYIAASAGVEQSQPLPEPVIAPPLSKPSGPVLVPMPSEPLDPAQESPPVTQPPAVNALASCRGTDPDRPIPPRPSGGTVTDDFGNVSPAPNPDLTGSPPTNGVLNPFEDPPSDSKWFNGGLDSKHFTTGMIDGVRSTRVPRYEEQLWIAEYYAGCYRKFWVRGPGKYGFFQYVYEHFVIDSDRRIATIRNGMSIDRYVVDDLQQGAGIRWYPRQNSGQSAAKMHDEPGFVVRERGATDAKARAALADKTLLRFGELTPEDFNAKQSVTIASYFVTYVIDLTRSRTVGWWEWCYSVTVSTAPSASVENPSASRAIFHRVST